MTKPSITENFINEPIPEDKTPAPCAAVRKSTPGALIIKAISQQHPAVKQGSCPLLHPTYINAAKSFFSFH